MNGTLSSKQAPQYTLALPPPMRGDLHEQSVHAYPREVCGLLLGTSKGHAAVVSQWWTLPGATDSDRFEFSSADLSAAFRRARELGLCVIGIWHSHPDHPAEPSETDRTAACEGWSHVIVSVSQIGVQDLRSWRFSQGDFHEEALTSA